jgi:hypothetical protein
MNLAILAAGALATGQVWWQASPPILSPASWSNDVCFSVKDPSIVRQEGRWHLFCTVRGRNRSHAVEYTSFADWPQAGTVSRHILSGISTGNFCAPQVFYFTPQKTWYLICQASDGSRYGPAFSTNATIANPAGWSPVTLLAVEKPAAAKAWLDFWVIADAMHAYLFFTSLDGKMWRCRTALGDFPRGWDAPQVALQGDVFEASHTYRLPGREQYLTIIEAQKSQPGWRYYKSYLADRLDGAWRPLTASTDQPFAGLANVTFTGERWTDSISHGELLRAGVDERMEIDPGNLRFLFQGVRDRDRTGKPYGEIPWRLGLLSPAP